jgi:hypothetical protein
MNAKLLIALALSLGFTPLMASDLSSQFAKPPASARPWVYWFWNNGNVTKAGITADLEAMKRAGIGGVIIMDVVERFAPPPGTADFMNAEWQELFHFAVAEAHRLVWQQRTVDYPGVFHAKARLHKFGSRRINPFFRDPAAAKHRQS